MGEENEVKYFEAIYLEDRSDSETAIFQLNATTSMRHIRIPYSEALTVYSLQGIENVGITRNPTVIANLLNICNGKELIKAEPEVEESVTEEPELVDTITEMPDVNEPETETVPDESTDKGMDYVPINEEVEEPIEEKKSTKKSKRGRPPKKSK